MSANNQTLIKEHDGMYYIFTNVMAESWDEANELSINEASGVHDSFQQAYLAAMEFDERDDTEYGVVFNQLWKDGAEVILLDNVEQK